MMQEGIVTVADIMNYIEEHGLNKNNFEWLVSAMLQAVCKDEHVDAVEEFIQKFDAIDWNWYPNG